MIKIFFFKTQEKLLHEIGRKTALTSSKAWLYDFHFKLTTEKGDLNFVSVELCEQIKTSTTLYFPFQPQKGC